MGYTKVGLVKTENVFNHVAARDPLATDDISNTSSSVKRSVEVGDMWLNTNTGLVYVCTDNTTDAAVWKLLSNTAYLKATFDATDGVAVGTVDLDLNLPEGAIIRYGFYSVETTFVSSGDLATLQLAVDAVDDGSELLELFAAVAINNGSNPWDATAAGDLASTDDTFPNWTTALSENGTVRVEVGVEALTAGKLHVYLDILVP